MAPYQMVAEGYQNNRGMIFILPQASLFNQELIPWIHIIERDTYAKMLFVNLGHNRQLKKTSDFYCRTFRRDCCKMICVEIVIRICPAKYFIDDGQSEIIRYIAVVMMVFIICHGFILSGKIILMDSLIEIGFDGVNGNLACTGQYVS